MWTSLGHQAGHQVAQGPVEAVSIATLQCVQDRFAVQRGEKDVGEHVGVEGHCTGLDTYTWMHI